MAGHTGDRQTVSDGLQHELPEARRVALGAAARLDMLTAEDLRPFLADRAPDVRHRAVELAGRLGDGHLLVDDLIALLTQPTDGSPGDDSPAADGPGPDPDQNQDQDPDPDPDRDDLAEVAAFVIGELDLDDDSRQRAAVALSSQVTDHHDPLCRESAVAALGALGVGLEAILAATGDVATVRRRAVLALAPFEGPEVDTAIETALEDRDWQVRQAAEDLSEPPGERADVPAVTDTDDTDVTDTDTGGADGPGTQATT